jgi:hypothetical protein
MDCGPCAGVCSWAGLNPKLRGSFNAAAAAAGVGGDAGVDAAAGAGACAFVGAGVGAGVDADAGEGAGADAEAGAGTTGAAGVVDDSVATATALGGTVVAGVGFIGPDRLS